MWGITLHFLFCEILYYEICIFVNTVHKMKWHAILFNFGTRHFFFGYSIVIMMYYIGNIVYPVPVEWLDNITKNCGVLDPIESLDPNL